MSLSTVISKKKQIWFILFLVFGFCLGSPELKAEDPAKMTAILTEITGQVSVIRTQDQKEVEAEEEMDLSPGDRIVTKDNASAEISFDDDSSVEVGENSDLTIKGLDVNPVTSRRHVSLSLVLGKIFSVVKKAMEGGHELTVDTPYGIAAVKGTEFGVELDKSSSHVGVYDGLVAVSSADHSAEVMVNPNQETSVSKGSKPEVARAFSRRWVAYKTRVTNLRQNIMELRELRKNGTIGKMREMRRLHWLQNHKDQITQEQKIRLRELKKNHPDLWKKIRNKRRNPRRRWEK